MRSYGKTCRLLIAASLVAAVLSSIRVQGAGRPAVDFKLRKGPDGIVQLSTGKDGPGKAVKEGDVYEGYADSTNTEKQNTIRILSYNIRHGVGVDGKLDLKRIAGVIRSASPDIVSLQEVDNKTKRSKRIDQAKELARLTHMKCVYGASMNFQGGKYGNAVLTTLPVKASKVIPLPGEPRSALCVTFKVPGKKSPAREFLFIATHLDTKKRPRLSSVPLIEKVFESRPKTPAVLAGDLNASPDSPTMRAFGKTWINSTSQGGLFTYPAKTPSRQIDYILHRPSKCWRVLETKVLKEAIASDHRPILAVLQFLPEAKEKKETAPKRADAGDGWQSAVRGSKEGTTDAVQWWTRTLPGDVDYKGMSYAIAMVSRGDLKAVSLVTSWDNNNGDVLKDTIALVRKVIAQEEQTLVKAHEEAWAGFWSRSGIELGDKVMERWWYRMLYFADPVPRRLR